jgi:hypothetical protein
MMTNYLSVGYLDPFGRTKQVLSFEQRVPKEAWFGHHLDEIICRHLLPLAVGYVCVVDLYCMLVSIMGLHGPKAVGETRTRSVGAIILRSLAQSCSFHQPATINGNAANNLCIVTISPIKCQRTDSKIFYSFVSHVVKYSMLRYSPSKVKPLTGCSIEPMVFCVVICIVCFFLFEAQLANFTIRSQSETI